MLTREQQCMAINLAMKIEMRDIDLAYVLATLKKWPHLTLELVTFWFQFDDMTRRALTTLVNAKCVEHLEKCWLQKEVNRD